MPGGTILLLQKWAHDAAEWEALPVAEQERVIGRTKLDSLELDDKPADSHVATSAARFFCTGPLIHRSACSVTPNAFRTLPR